MTQTIIVLVVFAVCVGGLGLGGFLALRTLLTHTSKMQADSTAAIGKIARDLLVPQSGEPGTANQPEPNAAERAFEPAFELFDADAARFLTERAKTVSANGSPLVPTSPDFIPASPDEEQP